MTTKPKLGFYWAASCGGCEITVTELGMRLVDVGELADIVFWPAAMDFKYDDVRAMDDGAIDICFFNGGIRTEENEEIAHLLRRKSRVLVAFGSCATEGCIPGLANLYTAESIMERVYLTVPTVDGTAGTLPQTTNPVPEGEIHLPAFHPRLKTLAQVTEVDYFMPGCPPVVEQVWKVFQSCLNGTLPPKGSVIGADDKTNCDTCPRQKGRSGFRLTEFKRPHQVNLDPETCFLAQGVICAGPVTRAGCGLPCLTANMPCRGCYGPPDGVVDQGARLISAIAALADNTDPTNLTKLIESVVDIVGTCYRFGLANSALNELKYK